MGEATVYHVMHMENCVAQVSTAGDVGKIDIVDFVFWTVLHLVVERTNLVVEAEMEDYLYARDMAQGNALMHTREEGRTLLAAFRAEHGAA